MSLTKVTNSMIQGACFSVKDFGAVGNCTGTGLGNDDTAAIQAALDYAASVGGGTVKLVQTSENYRITSTLRIPSYVTFEGVAPSRFPYGGGSELWADFTVQNSWIIESATLLSGAPIAYNHELLETEPYAFTFNCCVKNMRITAIGSIIPYGGIRLNACPGSTVYDVSLVGTGIGLLVNVCWGGEYIFHCLTYYYGVVGWNSCNANTFDIYTTQYGVANAVVPAGYVLSGMNALDGTMIAYGFHTNAHYNRTWGLIFGASGGTITPANRVKYIGEQWSGGCFQIFAYGTVFEQFYTESNPNVMEYAFAAAVTRCTVNSMHTYTAGTGVVFDLGVIVQASITPIGFMEYGTYGYGPTLDGTSSVTIVGVSRIFGPQPPQWNMAYPSDRCDFIAPTLVNSWVNTGGNNAPAGYVYTVDGNIRLKGNISGGLTGTVAFTLPAGYRPYSIMNYVVFGGSVLIEPDGRVIVTGTNIWLSDISFQARL